MDISLIQVPYHAGDDRHPAGAGPGRLIEAGAVDLLTSQGHEVAVERAIRDAPFRDTASSSGAVNKTSRFLVRRSLSAGRFPLVLAGSCVTSHGVLGRFDHASSGAVWIDAHADFNTPETSASGFFPGMSLAVLTGHCYRDYWAQIGDSTPPAEDSVVMFGVRDVSPEAERERLSRSAIHVVHWHEGKPRSDVLSPLDALRKRVRDIYLHIDLDGFAPELAPGVVDEPVPGGLSLEDAERIIQATGERLISRP
jgi:arginase